MSDTKLFEQTRARISKEALAVEKFRIGGLVKITENIYDDLERVMADRVISGQPVRYILSNDDLMFLDECLQETDNFHGQKLLAMNYKLNPKLSNLVKATASQGLVISEKIKNLSFVHGSFVARKALEEKTHMTLRPFGIKQRKPNYWTFCGWVITPIFYKNYLAVTYNIEHCWLTGNGQVLIFNLIAETDEII